MLRRPLLALSIALAGCDTGPPAPPVFRVATYNIQELSTARLLAVDSTGAGADFAARAAAAIIQRLRPDVLLLNEIDHDLDHPDDLALNARRFATGYLAQGPDSIHYPYLYAAPNNTGRLSGLDLDRDGVVATDLDRGQPRHGGDAFGFGLYPGQYSMAVLSRLPLATGAARTFQRFRWVDLPGNRIPPGYYSDTALQVFRLSSKSHWDLPFLVGGDTVHLLASHPTPPVFDGPEDRNGRRNFDEIGFWVRYLDGSAALVDDGGRRGGLGPSARFVIAGDLNARPNDSTGFGGPGAAIGQLLRDPRIQDPGGGPTARFLGGSRVDYLLPGPGLEIVRSGVFWPDSTADPVSAALAAAASDHRLVWLDLRIRR